MRPYFAQTHLTIHDEDFVIVSLSPEDRETMEELIPIVEPFSSVTYTEDEVSMVLKESTWREIGKAFTDYESEGPYRVITFDIILDLGLVGYLSVVSTRLAESGISIYALSTFLKDHILVRKSDAEKALKVLRSLIEESGG